MDNLFKNTAVELYIKRIKEAHPDMSEYDLELVSYAFMTGFNMGRHYSFSLPAQELALSMMVR